MPRTRIKIIPHLDYAELTQRYRRCREVKECRRDIIMYPISPYTPQLNPTECIWPLRRRAISKQGFDNLDAL
ncbi:hypothetical protein [Chlorogloeopsis sp. ULAP02]|uniref:hypothetical protein n=1 Tax=Chlorogloeopsis sp. ULAP02 TaxID=3107926 RepID=UPI003136B299